MVRVRLSLRPTPTGFDVFGDKMTSVALGSPSRRFRSSERVTSEIRHAIVAAAWRRPGVSRCVDRRPARVSFIPCARRCAALEAEGLLETRRGRRRSSPRWSSKSTRICQLCRLIEPDSRTASELLSPADLDRLEHHWSSWPTQARSTTCLTPATAFHLDLVAPPPPLGPAHPGTAVAGAGELLPRRLRARLRRRRRRTSAGTTAPSGRYSRAPSGDRRPSPGHAGQHGPLRAGAERGLA